jgi:ParB-like chromosome segregation protein Spo0J
MQTEAAEPKVLKTVVTDLQQVDHRNIVVEEGFNKRGADNYGDIEGLARSLVKFGVIEALIGYKKRGEDKFILTEGHRRLKAIQLAFQNHAEGKPGFENIDKIRKVPFRVASSTLKDRLMIMAITGKGKQPLTDMEKAALYSELIGVLQTEGLKRGDAIKEVCGNLGVSQATVYNVLALNELPEEIKTSISTGKISGSTVVAITREIKDEAGQVAAVREAIADAEKTAQTEGKKAAKKATASNVKGLKAKSPMQKLTEVADKLTSNGVNNTRAKALIEAVNLLAEGGSVNKIYELFK